MKRTIVSAAAVVVCVGLFGLAMTARGQAQGGKPAPQKVPHRIGLVDMAEVFQKYKKFENLRESLKSEIEQADREVKQLATQAQELQKRLNSGPYKEGTPEYKKLEDQLIQLKSQFETKKAQAQRDFLRKESQIYKTVYLEAADACRAAAEYFELTLVLRFNRKALQEADDPRGILQSMNKQVVYYRGEDDITESVIDYLNRAYARQQGGSRAAGSGGNGGTRRK